MPSNSLPPLLQLPPEILEHILSALARPHDLLSLALTSSTCHHLIIPHHLHYRTLRLRTPRPALWAHLAQRTDRASSIRTLRLCPRGDHSVPDRFPPAVEEPDEREWDERKRMEDVCAAVKGMRALETFVWAYEPDVRAGLRLDRGFEEGVVGGVVKGARRLRRLALGGQCAAHVREGRGVGKGGWYPVWEIGGLEALALRGPAWVERSNAVCVVNMLQRSPDLEFLEVPMELPTLVLCRFPRLKRLTLPMATGTSTSSTNIASPTTSALAVFLAAHPALEDLAYAPPRPIVFTTPTPAPTPILPALRRLKASLPLFDALERHSSETGTQRPIEDLDVWGLEAERIASAQSLDPKALRRVKITHVGPLHGIRALAGRFTGIRWLGLPAYHKRVLMEEDEEVGHHGPFVVELAEWLDLLPLFPALEVFRGPGLWTAVEGSKERMHEAILELVCRCPRLVQLDHCAVDERRGAVKVIWIFREEGGGEERMGRVWYEVRKLPPREIFDFDTMGGTFD